MIHQDTHFTTSVDTGYHRVFLGQSFKTRSARVRVPGHGSAPCWDIHTAPDQWGADRPKGMREWQLILTLGGEGCFQSGEAVFRAKKNAAVLYPPGFAQKYGLDTQCKHWEHVWVAFLPQTKFLPFLSWPQVIPGVPSIELPKTRTGKALCDTLVIAHYHRHSAATTAHLQAMLAVESFLLGCVNLRRPSVSPLDPRVADILSVIENEYASPIRLEYLAKKCGLSASRIEHLVRQQTGNPIRVHLENERIRRAKHLLEFTRQTISEIAYAVGYQTPRHFCTRFKLSERCTPGQFRAVCSSGNTAKTTK